LVATSAVRSGGLGSTDPVALQGREQLSFLEADVSFQEHSKSHEARPGRRVSSQSAQFQVFGPQSGGQAEFADSLQLAQQIRFLLGKVPLQSGPTLAGVSATCRTRRARESAP
jgi:hypothetical protein